VPQRIDGPPSGASDSIRKPDYDLTSRAVSLPARYSQWSASVSERDSSLIIFEPLASYSTTQTNHGSRFVSERTKTQCKLNDIDTASFSRAPLLTGAKRPRACCLEIDRHTMLCRQYTTGHRHRPLTSAPCIRLHREQINAALCRRSRLRSEGLRDTGWWWP
jgi:hypothetical protein